jgi:hypothetical protein
MRAWFHRTNRAYDELDQTHPCLRFLIFFTPLWAATMIDLALELTGVWNTHSVILLATMSIMAIWRFLGRR